MRHGIATIYQELDLVNGLSVAENIFLGHEPATFGFSHRAEADRAAAELLRRLGHGEIGDRVTVLKDGRTVAVGLAAKDTPTSQIVR